MRGITRFFSVALALCAASFASGFAQSAQSAPATLTIDQAVEAALRNNMSVRSAETQARIKKRASDFGFNALYPSVSVSASAIRLNTASPVLVPVSELSTDVYGAVYQYTPDRENLSLALTVQEVFSPAILESMNQASIEYQASETGANKARRQITASVKKMFYRLMVQKATIELTGSRLDAARERLRQAQLSYELGQGTELSCLYARADVETLIPNLRSMETARIAALTQFQEILGFEKRDDMELSGSLDDGMIKSPGDIGTGGTPFSVIEAQTSLARLKSAARAQGMGFLPVLSARFTCDPTINGPTADTLFDSSNWSQSSGGLSVTLSWDLSDLLPGSATLTERAALKDKLAVAGETAANAAINAAHDEDNQVRQIGDSLAKIGNLQNVVDTTKRSFELTEAAYSAGVGRYLDLRAAEISWRNAQMQLLSEKLNLMSWVFDLEAQYGSMN